MKSKLYFEIEAPFWNWGSISNSKVHFEMEALFRNQSPILKLNLLILKWKLNFEIEALDFEIEALDFEIEARFWNPSSIL